MPDMSIVWPNAVPADAWGGTAPDGARGISAMDADMAASKFEIRPLFDSFMEQVQPNAVPYVHVDANDIGEYTVTQPTEDEMLAALLAEQPVKRGRGRPRKHPRPEQPILALVGDD